MDDATARRVSDQLAITNLVARLAHLADMGGDLEEYLDCFTDDAVWEFPGNPALDLPPGHSAGRHQIAADRVRRRGDRFQGPGTGTRHLNTTLAVDVRTADTADATSYWLFVAAPSDGTDGPGGPDGPDGPVVRAMGAYHDTFRRTGGRWRLAHRRIVAG